MACFKFLIILFAFTANIAFAGYAQLKPPPGWSQGMGAAVPGVSGTFSFGAAANAGSFKGQTVLTNAALNVAGQLITVPVGLRVAANAASLAASYSFGNPTLFVLALGLPIAYGYWRQHDLRVGPDGTWLFDEVTSGLATQYAVETSPWFASRASACAWLVNNPGNGYGYVNSPDYSFSVTVSGTQCKVAVTYKSTPPVTTYGYHSTVTRVDDSKVINTRPARLTDFEKAINDDPLHDGAIKEIPINWPVEMPQINPDPAIEPLSNPSPAPASRPLWLPMSEPIKQPSVEGQPDTWKQPGVDVIPAPTSSEPWRVEVTPRDSIKDDPTPYVPPENPVENSDATNPNEPSDLCKLHPEIVACQKLDTPESEELETKNKDISITPDSGWGSGGGSCPAPRNLKHAQFSFQPYCDFASGIRPVIIAVAWLVAAGILIGFKFGD